jgi:hypothetical protein
MTENNSVHKLNSITSVITYYNQLIFDKQNWKQKEIWKIAEVTYSYHKET